MNSFLDGESLAVWTPLDENAMVIVDVAPETLVLLGSEVLGVPDQDGPVFSTARQVLTISTQVHVCSVFVKNIYLKRNFYQELFHCDP